MTKQRRPNLEVLILDVLLRERVVAEYRHEVKYTRFGTTARKVYHPLFENGFRWTEEQFKVLGPLMEGVSHDDS